MVYLELGKGKNTASHFPALCQKGDITVALDHYVDENGDDKEIVVLQTDAE